MGDRGASLGGEERGKAGIAEEVQHFQRPVRAGELPRNPVPVRLLLGEHADMAERGEAPEESHAADIHRPGLGERLPEPPATVGVLVLRPGEDGIGGLPFGGRPALLPHRLRLGADDAVAAIAFELLAGTRIEERIVRPAGRFEHQRGERLIRADIGSLFWHGDRIGPCDGARGKGVDTESGAAGQGSYPRKGEGVPMELKGSRHLAAPPESVWAAVSDPVLLQEMLPGARSVRTNPADPKEMLVEIDVVVGPLTAVFTGQIRRTESDPPRRAKLTGEGRGRPGGLGLRLGRRDADAGRHRNAARLER